MSDPVSCFDWKKWASEKGEEDTRNPLSSCGSRYFLGYWDLSFSSGDFELSFWTIFWTIWSSAWSRGLQFCLWNYLCDPFQQAILWYYDSVILFWIRCFYFLHVFLVCFFFTKCELLRDLREQWLQHSSMSPVNCSVHQTRLSSTFYWLNALYKMKQ